MKVKSFLIALCLLPQALAAQDSRGPMNLKDCLDWAIGNNASLQKDRIALESAAQSRREIIGSLLPQIGASGSMAYNIQKTTIAMPNFVNSMMPEPMRDPNAAKYMTVTMGMDLSANWGFSLTQQVINFSLFSAVGIAKSAEEMARLGTVADTDDVVAKVATLYYNAQILQYSLDLFDESLAVMGRMAAMMETNKDLGITRSVDADRIVVAKVNLETEKQSLVHALEVQKNILKLEMGYPMSEPLEVAPADIECIESMIFMEPEYGFELERQLPFRMLKQQQNMLHLQRKSAIGEVLPALMLQGTYSENYMGDHFYGETFHHFPMSMVSLNLKVPIFTGMSKSAKIKKAALELEKSYRDEDVLSNSLKMNYDNASMQMEQNRSTIRSQKRNKELAMNVLEISEKNYNEGLASLSDVLNASSSLIQAQMNYVNALSGSIKAYIDLKKANGTISEINR